MSVAIVDYGLGNLRSVAGAVEHLGHAARITAEPAELRDAAKLILPGVGAFGDGMAKLRARGLDEALTREVVEGGKPLLGICLGFQLLAEASEEFGEHQGLGWIAGRVTRLRPDDASLPVPHVGWNELHQVRPSRLFAGIADGALFYFVHSYRLAPRAGGLAVGETDYGGRFVAAIERDNILGTQFHPEKSQKDGLAVLGNFLGHA